MTRLATEGESIGAPAAPFVGLEVSTVAADTLRASVRVAGTLTVATTSLVSSILRTHVTAGRRYLRLDLTAAELADPAVVAALAEAHRGLTALGGTLVFENGGPDLARAVDRLARALT